MIFIVVKYLVKPQEVETFIQKMTPFTEATRAEPGNKWFEWSRSLERENEFILVEAFEEEAAAAHVNSEHFARGLETMRPLLLETPRIISRTIEGDDWDFMGELVIEE